MRNSLAVRFSLLIPLFTLLCVSALSPPASAHETEIKVPDPGFRPYSEHTPAFLEALDTTTVAVYPSIIRRANRTAHSFASQKQIVALLKEKKIFAARQAPNRIDLGALQGTSQWDLFLNDMWRIAYLLKDRQADADYHLFMEFLFPVDDKAVFGIEVYVLNRNGDNAFSFLLNSHHELFVNADLIAGNSSQGARATLLEKATQVGVTALEQQIYKAQECAARSGTSRIVSSAGVFDDFEHGLPSGRDQHGIPIGYVTFTDGKSDLRISTTTTYPPRTANAGGGNVLRMDLDVTDWAAFAHVFENDSVDQWISYDWSAFDQFSFRFFGTNSGTSLFVDILDNRKPCSTVDDAERYVHTFADDVQGWKLVTIRFADMWRKEVGNGALKDGLGLSAVHGWAIGAMSTDGPTTHYVDDFELRASQEARMSDAVTAADETPDGSFLRESPIDGTSSTMTFAESDMDETYVVEKSVRLLCECARVTRKKGFNYFVFDDQKIRGDGRIEFRIQFYDQPPAGMTVIRFDDMSGRTSWGVAESGEQLFDARETARFCETWNSAQALESAAFTGEVGPSDFRSELSTP